MTHTQQINGRFRSIKNYISYFLVMLYLLSSWIRWDRGVELPNQALFIDLPQRMAYIFGITIWPDDLYLLTGALLIAALTLFIISSLFGRIWCGYACPHTVFTDFFIKIEAFIQGDRNARIKLDSSEPSINKFIKKSITHLVWIIISFIFAFGWVCYFYDSMKLISDIFAFKVTKTAIIWLLALTFSTYLFAGFIRKRVCLYMCPYGRFQSAMIEDSTKVITYNQWRSNDCIDCKKCVVVCPMDIDIRDGLQIGCIGCGLCVDACDPVMDKINKPRGLISYDSVITASVKQNILPITRKKAITTKLILFISALFVAVVVMLYSAICKEAIDISMLHDRSQLFTVLPDYTIRNTYTLKIVNKQPIKSMLRIYIDSPSDAKIKIQGGGVEYSSAIDLYLKPLEIFEAVLFIKIPYSNTSNMQNDVVIKCLDLNTQSSYIVNSKFLYQR